MKDINIYASNIAGLKELEKLLPKYKAEATKALQQANNIEYNGKAKLGSSGYILDDGVLVNGAQSGHIDVQSTVFSGLPEDIQDKIGNVDYYDLLDFAGCDDAIDKMFTNNANILECIYKNPIRVNSDDSSTYVSLCDKLTATQAETLADWLDLVLYSNGAVDISLSDPETNQVYFSGILSLTNYDTDDVINFIKYTQNNKRPPSTAVLEELRNTKLF